MASSLPLAICSHPHCLAHDTGAQHPESPARLQRLFEEIAARPHLAGAQRLRPAKPERRWLTTFHDEEYLLRLEETALSGRSHIDHQDNQLSFDSFEAALLAAGAGLAAIDLLERQEARVFCAVRPPGHHAERNLALGFCLLNNAVLAARYWQERHGRRKIMIIDWDAHHGNGIQSAFEEDPEVFYLSIHEHPTFSFPGSGYAEERGTGAGLGATLNIPLLPGADDRLVRAVLREKVFPALREFRPEALIVCAGFDGHREDDMSGLAYSTELYGHLGTMMAAWADAFCRGRLLSLLEGGYHLESLGPSVAAYLLALAGRATDHEEQPCSSPAT